jgi:hypothetical protein
MRRKVDLYRRREGEIPFGDVECAAVRVHKILGGSSIGKMAKTGRILQTFVGLYDGGRTEIGATTWKGDAV